MNEFNQKIGSGSGGIIARPQDPYSQLWPQYWAQNPHLKRGVGADGVDDDVPPPPAPNAEMDALKAQIAAMTEENNKYKLKHQEAEKHRKEQEKAAREAQEKAAKASGDLEAYERSWTEKHNAALGELNDTLASQRAMIDRLTVGNTATKLAADLAIDGCADGLLPHIQGRLKTEIVEGNPVVKVLDKSGNVSAMTIDDLVKELKTYPYIAPLIKGSLASGGGGPSKSGGHNNPKLKTQAEVRNMNPIDQAAYFKSVADQPARFSD